MSRPEKSEKPAQPDLLRRPLLVLETLAAMEQPASLLAIASAVGLSKAGAYRVLRALQDDGYIDHAGRRGYRIGSRSIALASLVGPRPALLERARPALSRLAAMAQATATLHLRSGEHRVLVLGTEQADRLRRRRVHIGERAPLTSGCSGRAILAYLPAEEAAAVVAEHTVGPRRAKVENQLDVIRADGYALSFSENHLSFNGIGAALLDLDTGYALGSIVVAGPEEQLPEAALRALARPLIAVCDGLAPHFAALLGPNSSARREALDVTISDLVAAARG